MMSEELMKKIGLAFIIIVWGTLMGIAAHGAQTTEMMADRYDIKGYSIAYR